MEYRGSFTIGRKENMLYNLFVSRGRLLSVGAIVLGVVTVVLSSSGVAKGLTFAEALLRSLPIGLAVSVLFLLCNIVPMISTVYLTYRKKRAVPFKQEILLDAKGLHNTSDHGEEYLKWKDMQRVLESASAFYIFRNERQAFVLPKEQMKNPEADAARIRAILRSHLDQKVLKIKR